MGNWCKGTELLGRVARSTGRRWGGHHRQRTVDLS